MGKQQQPFRSRTFRPAFFSSGVNYQQSSARSLMSNCIFFCFFFLLFLFKLRMNLRISWLLWRHFNKSASTDDSGEGIVLLSLICFGANSFGISARKVWSFFRQSLAFLNRMFSRRSMANTGWIRKVLRRISFMLVESGMWSESECAHQPVVDMQRFHTACKLHMIQITANIIVMCIWKLAMSKL